MESSTQDSVETSGRKRWRPTPSMLIAMLALFVALGGTASALSGKFSVKKGDIAPKAVQGYALQDGAVTAHKIKANAVTSAKIKDKQVGPYKLNLGSAAGEAAEVTTTASVASDLGGPTVSVKAPAGSTIQVRVQASMRATGSNTARVYLYEPTLLPTPQKIVSSTSTANFQTKYSTPGTGTSGADDGVTNVSRSGWITIPAGSGGTKTFSLRYDTTGGTAIFKDRQIFVNVVQ
jgi:hypothetical protein